MKVTVFTSNQPRHLHLINRLASVADECFAVQECTTVFPGQVKDFFNNSETFQAYFANVIESEHRQFGQIRFAAENVRQLAMKSGDLSKLPEDVLTPALASDVYIVFGASFIRGWLIDALIERSAINIHMGVWPYYRGSSCNFWALNDDNPQLVGSTIHRLSKGLDSGDMLYHALPTTKDCVTPFDYSMRAVSAAHESLIERISDGSLLGLPTHRQDKGLEVRYTRNADFDDPVAQAYLDRGQSIEDLNRLLAERQTPPYVDPFFW